MDYRQELNSMNSFYHKKQMLYPSNEMTSYVHPLFHKLSLHLFLLSFEKTTNNDIFPHNHIGIDFSLCNQNAQIASHFYMEEFPRIAERKT